MWCLWPTEQGKYIFTVSANIDSINALVNGQLSRWGMLPRARGEYSTVYWKYDVNSSQNKYYTMPILMVVQKIYTTSCIATLFLTSSNNVEKKKRILRKMGLLKNCHLTVNARDSGSNYRSKCSFFLGSHFFRTFTDEQAPIWRRNRNFSCVLNLVGKGK